MTVPEYILTRKAVVTLVSVLAAVALLFAASPAAAQPQTTDGPINYTIEPANAEAPNGDVQTYSINVVNPNEGIAVYSEVIVNVTNTSVADITSVTETRTSGNGEAVILGNGDSLLVRRSLGGNTYDPAPEITIATFEVTATGSAGQSTALEYDLTNGRLITRNQSNVIYNPVQPPGPNAGGDKANLAPRAVSNASFSIVSSENFQVSNLQPASTTVTSGTALDISADIENTGGVQGTQTVTLSVGTVTQTQTRTLNASENTTVTFSVDTAALGPGTYTPEISSANDSATGSLTVQAPADFGVSVQSTNSPVVEGETLDVTATLQNTGDVSGTQTVDLNVGTLGSDSQSVTLASGASQNVTLSVGTTSGEVGTFTATVSSANDSVSQSVTVQDQATVELRATDGSVRLGKNTTVQVVASGVTTDVGSYDIDISLNDSAASVLAVDVLGTVTSDNTVLTGSSVSLNASVTGTGSGEVVLANLTVQFDTNASASRGIYQRGDGTASVGVTGATLVDSTGSVSVTQRTNTTVSAVGPPAIDGRFPADPDNDGLYEDLTGFGNAVTVGDVQTLFDRGISNPRPSLTKYTPFYNFATGFGGPQLSVGDVQSLFNET